VPYSPVELRHVRIGRALFGFRRDEVMRLLDEVADSFEAVWRDRGELSDKTEELERRLEEFKQREHLLSQTLVAAERSAAEAREAARRDAELIVAEAHQEARSVMRAAQRERERLVAEARRVEILLRSALGLIEESVHDEAGSDSWPQRYDTREFAAIELEEEPHDEVEPEPEEESPAQDVAPGRDFNWG
jgi:cell division initiation protein